tara:strand:+ start:2527 stop:3192 length:666 start_codon:yes stop_codon:yes gene_type:complete
MGVFRKYIFDKHNSVKRDYLDRMLNNKPKCVKLAKKFGYAYWDGSRRTGFGGYKYIDGYWTKLAKNLIKDYKLKDKSKILEVGCGKGFLLHELKKINPKFNVSGFDISRYALKRSTSLVKKNLYYQKAQSRYKYKNKEIDFLLSINVLHSLKIYDFEKAINEINRVSKKSYIVVESYRNEKELFNLQCWNTVGECFFDPSEWKYLFKKLRYNGDYEFIFFQ